MIRRSAPEGRRSIPRGQVVRLLLGVAVVLVLLVGYSAFGALTTASRTGEGVAVAGGERIDLVVSMAFEPEPYHLDRLRRLGTVAGRFEGDETKVRLLRVEAEDLRQLTRITWISHLDRLER